MKMSLNREMIRRVISIAVAIIIALIVERYYSLTHLFLIPLTAIIVMLTPVGSYIYFGILRLLGVVILVGLLTLLLPPHAMVYDRLYDVYLGGVIGVVINMLILPRRIDAEFRSAMLPLLKSYEDYFSAIVLFLFEKNNALIEQKKLQIEQQLQQLPTWVYSRGFDVGLKKGHQYFLMKVQHIAEILFAMHHVARVTNDEELLESMREPVDICAQRIRIFFQALITVFELKKLSEGIEDFEVELFELDRKFQAMMPVTLELLDISREDVSFYGFIYSLSDLRKALLRLAQALR